MPLIDVDLSVGFFVFWGWVQGLEAQLLGIVVRKERPELEQQKDSLVISIAAGKKSLQDLEDEILRFVHPTLQQRTKVWGIIEAKYQEWKSDLI